MRMTTDQKTANPLTFTIKELMAVTGLGRNTCLKIGQKSGAYTKIGSRVVYKADKIIKYLDEQNENSNLEKEKMEVNA